MKKLLFFIFIFSLFTMTAEAKQTFSRNQGNDKHYLPFAPKAKNKKHRTIKQRPVKHSLNFKFKNCLK